MGSPLFRDREGRARIRLMIDSLDAARAVLREARQPFDSMDVERINILNENGMPALVMAEKGWLIGPTVDVRSVPPGRGQLPDGLNILRWS